MRREKHCCSEKNFFLFQSCNFKNLQFDYATTEFFFLATFVNMQNNHSFREHECRFPWKGKFTTKYENQAFSFVFLLRSGKFDTKLISPILPLPKHFSNFLTFHRFSGHFWFTLESISRPISMSFNKFSSFSAFIFTDTRQSSCPFARKTENEKSFPIGESFQRERNLPIDEIFCRSTQEFIEGNFTGCRVTCAFEDSLWLFWMFSITPQVFLALENAAKIPENRENLFQRAYT